MISEVRRQVCRKVAPEREYVGGTVVNDDGTETSYFDPWEIFPVLYGTYSSGFDEMAIKVLTGLASGNYWPETLAEEMFQEMLCTADLCDYGTSPRSCWPVEEFAEILPLLIEKWKAYAAILWGETK